MANLDQPKALRQYLLAKPDVTESFPFGDDVAVFKVRNKMFALFGIEEGVVRLNLKCDPDEACALRDIYPSVIPGYHMNKKHWNTVICDGSVPQGELSRMIDNSFSLVVATLPKKQQIGLLAD